MDKEKFNGLNEKLSALISDKIVFFESLKLDLPTILIIISVFFFILIIILLSKKNKKKKSVTEKASLKPVLSEIVDDENELFKQKSEDNDFVDVLVAIEEEMAAVRELYVGGYITKGIYISETDRLYEKAKVFGL